MRDYTVQTTIHNMTTATVIVKQYDGHGDEGLSCTNMYIDATALCYLNRVMSIILNILDLIGLQF